MLSTNFTTYNHSDGLNSLSMKCVHILCLPIANIHNRNLLNLSSIFDPNVVYRSQTQSAPIRLIEILYKNFYNQYPTGFKAFLDINSWQLIHDYIIRENIRVTVNFICYLLHDYGVYNFDLWKLCKICKMEYFEIVNIFNQMSNCPNFRKLSLCGNLYFLTYPIFSKTLNSFFSWNYSLQNLRELTLQDLLDTKLFTIFYACPNLQYFAVAEPSLTQNDILTLCKELQTQSLPICESLREVVFPSSIKEFSIMNFLSYFPNIIHLTCTPFEQLMDLIDSQRGKKLIATKAAIVLNKLRSLSIAHPMSRHMVNRLLTFCPNIEQLSLTLQKYMDLSILATKAPCLQKLELHNFVNEISFISDILPILRHCGKQIKCLSLINFEEIDLNRCAAYCPNLEVFSAQAFSVITLQSRMLRMLKVKKPFSKLRELRLQPLLVALPENVCSLMLKNCTNLRHIELYQCQRLTDHFIYEIIQQNKFDNLQILILNGHSATTPALARLISRATLSNNLIYHDCDLMPPGIK